MTPVFARMLFGVLAFLVGFATYAADKKTRDEGLSRGDREFVEKAMMGGITEVELGKLAQQKGMSEAVKTFGQRMVDDHSRAGEELKGIASKVGYVPKKEPGPDQKAVKELSNKSGSRFDHEYAEQMVDDHEKTVKLFRRQAEKGDNAELKQFAAKTLPTLEEHLKMSRDLKDHTKGKKK